MLRSMRVRIKKTHPTTVVALQAPEQRASISICNRIIYLHHLKVKTNVLEEKKIEPLHDGSSEEVI